MPEEPNPNTIGRIDFRIDAEARQELRYWYSQTYPEHQLPFATFCRVQLQKAMEQWKEERTA